MTIQNRLTTKKAVVFGLDDVLYPEKDYLLQVYYLFAEFMAYSMQLDAKNIIAFMQSEYASNGPNGLFQKTAEAFEIPASYEANFDRLHQNARLPLKLLLYKQILELLQELVVNRQAIFLLVDGDPAVQLNKIKQMEWHALEQYLKVYFSVEFKPKPAADSMEFLLNEHQLTKKDVILIGNTVDDQEYAAEIGVDYLSVKEIIE